MIPLYKLHEKLRTRLITWLLKNIEWYMSLSEQYFLSIYFFFLRPTVLIADEDEAIVSSTHNVWGIMYFYVLISNKATTAGFEPALAMPNGLAGHPLNHSGTLSQLYFLKINTDHFVESLCNIAVFFNEIYIYIPSRVL